MLHTRQHKSSYKEPVARHHPQLEKGFDAKEKQCTIVSMAVQCSKDCVTLPAAPSALAAMRIRPLLRCHSFPHDLGGHCRDYPLARNQYINNSPGIFSCIRAGANTGATCIRTEMKSLKNLPNMRKMIPQKYFPVFARVRIQAPHVFAQKLIPQEFFPACIGFVPGYIL